MSTPTFSFVYTQILICVHPYPQCWQPSMLIWRSVNIKLRVYTYETLGVHIRVFGCLLLRIRCIQWEIGCTHKSVYVQKSLICRKFIFIFYNKKTLSGISSKSQLISKINLPNLCIPPLRSVCLKMCKGKLYKIKFKENGFWGSGHFLYTFVLETLKMYKREFKGAYMILMRKNNLCVTSKLYRSQLQKNIKV